MPTLLLTFANSSANPLPTLAEEFDGVSDALRERAARKDFVISSDPIANRDKIIKDIRAYQNDIFLFLFSGHAGRDLISLTDGEANSEGIAGLLGTCKNLGLVVLNGCSTAGQVKSLLDQAIPIVIATSSPVGDQKATQFSISFFRELAKGRSIREAFTHSMEETRVYGQIEKVEITSRGLVTNQEAADRPLWGIYYNPPNEALLDTWRLPISVSDAGSENINKDIKRALLAIAKRYAISPGVNPVLEKFPFLINEPIRNLFAIRAETQEDNRFYDTPSWERFQMILYAYRSVINLTTYVLLAELWDESLQTGKQSSLPDECQQLLQSTLFTERNSDQQLSNLPLLLQLAQLLKDKQPSCFLTEISTLLDDINKEIPKKALAYLESKIADQDTIKTTSTSDAATLRLCLDTEKNFSMVLFAFGFMVNYSLTSVKDIELLKYRYLKSPSFVHQIIPLQIGYIVATNGENYYASGSPLDTTSIFFHRHGESFSEACLNLSPFLLDKNALIKAPKADLHYLLYYSAEQQVFCFRRATSYEEVWAIRPEKKVVSSEDDYFGLGQEADEQEECIPLNFYPLLEDQLASFSEKVLLKTLDNL